MDGCYSSVKSITFSGINSLAGTMLLCIMQKMCIIGQFLIKQCNKLDYALANHI